MNSKYVLRVISLLALLVVFVPSSNADALASTTVPPTDLFQLPWEQGLAWVAIDGLDNGTRRPLDSSHHYSVGGAIDFAPHNGMRVGEDTSTFWVTAAADGTVIEKSFCHLKIDHANGWITEYQFLANVQVKLGDGVYRNQRLGIIADGQRQKFCPGRPGLNVPHLHFMLRPSLRNATFAGWEINYNSIINRTTFTKNGLSLGLYQPLLNVPGLQIVLREPITWDVSYPGSVDVYRYERWPFILNESNKFTLTATPTTNGLVPLLILLDAGGNEMTRGTGTLTSLQPAGNYFVQVQPQAGNGLYNLLLQRNDQPIPSDAYVASIITPANIEIGGTAVVSVSLNNVPAEGYTSVEFTCTYNASLIEVSNIMDSGVFGVDAAMAVHGPQNGSFIVAIAGSNGNKAINSGTAFTFSAKGLQAGQSTVECGARVSAGGNALTEIESLGATLTIGGMPGPTPTPAPVESPTPTITPAPITPTIPPPACDQADFISHITIPTGTVLQPGTPFTKTWRVQNVSTCGWTTSYQLVFFSGEQMSAPALIPFSTNVAAGQTVDISLNMTAPVAPGSYQGYWMFRNAQGDFFGSGPQADQPLSVDIVVSTSTATPSPTAIPPASDWLTFVNTRYEFEFQYPKEGQLAGGNTDNHARLNLPFVQGTNLSEKYLDVIVVEKADNCHSPLATSSMLETSETVVINDITFLKETGGDGTAGHINKWTAFSTRRDNVCVSLDFVLRAANPGVFSTPPPLYDEMAETAVFGQIVATYKWLTFVPSATPTASIPTQTATPTWTPTSTATPLPTTGTLSGQVLASKPVTVSVYDATDTLVTSVIANLAGTFSLTVPAGTYSVRAETDGFLSAQGSATLTAGDSKTMPTVSLLAGDIDGNQVIDPFDAMTIGMSYNTATPSEADLNHDGVINVLDLEQLARNYRKTGPVAWE